MPFQKISILPPWKVFLYCTNLTPGNSSLALYFASKILTFKTPLPLGISDDLPWGGYGFFSETFFHIASNIYLNIRQKKNWLPAPNKNPVLYITIPKNNRKIKFKPRINLNHNIYQPHEKVYF